MTFTIEHNAAKNPPGERGIPFSAEMVRAIIDGKKTQTRRTVGIPKGGVLAGDVIGIERVGDFWRMTRKLDRRRNVAWVDDIRCPYGVVGDRLWVREAWRILAGFDDLSGSQVADALVRYEADGTTSRGVADAPRSIFGRYRHARFMPRWASRLTLELVEVRTQRVQEVTAGDARAEGCDARGLLNVRGEFCALWGRVNGLDSWSANPWVWALTFKRVEAAKAAA